MYIFNIDFTIFIIRVTFLSGLNNKEYKRCLKFAVV